MAEPSPVCLVSDAILAECEADFIQAWSTRVS